MVAWSEITGIISHCSTSGRRFYHDRCWTEQIMGY